jgi:uncharacterized protein with NRDE domain
MCVIYFAYNVHPDHPLVLIANRDEFYDRPTKAAAYWDDHPEIFAGRDLVGGGTWLGITRSGRIAAVTNYREPGAEKGSVSRGDLVAGFLKSAETPEDYLAHVVERQQDYSGFNLLIGEFGHERSELFYFSNRGDGIERINSGVYGLSNRLLDTAWPKVRDGKSRFRELINSGSLETDPLFELLADESLAADAELPDTGIGYEREKALSAIFIKTPIYGTRSSTVVTFDNTFEGRLEERVFV